VNIEELQKVRIL